MKQEFFPVGATYAPLPKATEVDIAEWPDDIANICKLGLTVFRLFICHDRVEQRRGERDFSRIDRAFELAQANHLKVIANIGGTFSSLQAIYPPRWLYDECHCSLRKPAEDSPEILRTTRLSLCYDDPVYQRESADFIREAVTRYRANPALLAWSGWNEPRLTECFCTHTVTLFREWLKRKYGTLEALSAAWSTEFPIRFRQWDDVYPQPTTGFEFGGYLPWLDWKAFQQQNRRDKFHLVAGWIKSADPETPVISHFCHPGDADIFGGEDISGTSIYTYHGQGKNSDELSDQEFWRRLSVHKMHLGRRAGRRDPDGFWVVETEAGPVSWVHDMAPRTYSPRKMNVRDMLFVAHGARAVLRWLYRSRISDAQAGEFNLVGWDGRITDRATEFGELSRFLNQHTADFLHHTPSPSGVLIWDNGEFEHHADAEGYRQRYQNSALALYQALTHVDVEARLCNNRQIAEGILAGCKVLFIPFHPYLAEEFADKIRAFVEQGGTVIAESPFAIRNEKMIHYEKTPGRLIDVFGAQVWDLEKIFEPVCGELPAFDFKARLEPRGGNVEAHFVDGSPAVVTHRYGKGRTVLYGSIIFLPYDNPEFAKFDYVAGAALRQELKNQLAQSGIHPACRLELEAPADRRAIHIRFRQLPDGGKLVFLLNISSANAAFRLDFEAAAQCIVLGSSGPGDIATFRAEKWECKLDPYGWIVLKTDKPS